MNGINLRDLARFVTIRSLEETEEEEEEEYDPEYRAHHWFPPVTEAQQEGKELLYSGDFGRVGVKIRSQANNGNLAKSVLNRAARPIPNLNKEDLLSVCFNFAYQAHELIYVHQNLVPNTNGTTVATYDANIYTAQFSDGTLISHMKSELCLTFSLQIHLFTTHVPKVSWDKSIT